MSRRPRKGVVLRRPLVVARRGWRVRLLGLYELGEDRLVLEAIVEAPGWEIEALGGPMELAFVAMEPWVEPPSEVIRLQFLLSRDGEHLTGSYLDLEMPEPPPRPEGRSEPFRVRFASIVPPGGGSEYWTPAGVLALPDPEPIPERLLRLIWFED